jgi:hypothetical protein
MQCLWLTLADSEPATNGQHLLEGIDQDGLQCRRFAHGDRRLVRPENLWSSADARGIATANTDRVHGRPVQLLQHALLLRQPSAASYRARIRCRARVAELGGQEGEALLSHAKKLRPATFHSSERVKQSAAAASCDRADQAQAPR